MFMLAKQMLQMKWLTRTNAFVFVWSYQVYGEETYMRSAQDIAFHVALFITKKGSYVNYYMVLYQIPHNLNRPHIDSSL